jgi:hypothetical protein
MRSGSSSSLGLVEQTWRYNRDCMTSCEVLGGLNEALEL